MRQLENKDSLTTDTRRKINFLQLTFSIGIGISLIFATSATFEQRYILSGIGYFLTVSFAICLLHIHYTQNPSVSTYFIIFTISAFIFYMTFKQGITHSPWGLVLPGVTMFLLGCRKGAAWLTFYFGLLVISCFNAVAWDFYQYPPAYQARYLAAFFSVAVITFFYEKTRQAAHEKSIALLDELSEKNRILSEVANRDGLTGLLNHRAVHEKLQLAFEEASRYQYPLSLIMLDIDNFKTINDRWGHPMGDKVIKGVSTVLKNTVRGSDVRIRFSENPAKDPTLNGSFQTAARYGGDEFVLLLPHCNHDHVLAVANRLLNHIRLLSIQNYEGVKVTASIGISFFDGQDETLTPQQLVEQADQALYFVKEQGRDNVHLNYPPLAN